MRGSVVETRLVRGSVFVYLNNGCGYKLNVHIMCGRKRKDNWVM